MSISVVVPCYNESEIIEYVIRTFHNEISKEEKKFEFLVVDDCSTDNTPEILSKLEAELPIIIILRPEKNIGHGKAIRLGYDLAKCDYILQVDGDNQLNAFDFPKFYKLKDNFDFILGYRVNRKDPISRLILTLIMKCINYIVFGFWIKDANCPYRLMKRKILHELLKSVDKEALTPNIILSILAIKSRLKFTEVPVSHNPKKTGFVFTFSWKLAKLSITAFFQLLKSIRI